MLTIENVNLAYGASQVIWNLSLNVEGGQITTIRLVFDATAYNTKA